MQVKKQQLELDMEQQTGSKQGKEDIKAAYYHRAYLTYMQSSLENPMDGGPWQAAVHGVAKSRTQLSDFTFPFTLLHLRAIQDTGQWVYSSE